MSQRISSILAQRPDFPVGIDNTMRSAFILCPRKFAYSFLHNLIPKGDENVHLFAGACFAKGLEVARMAYYNNNQSAEHSLMIGMLALTEAWGTYEPPTGHVKSYINMLGALVSYLDYWPFDHDTLIPVQSAIGPMVEFTFAIPLEGTKHPQTGEPIIYFGRADMIGELGLSSRLNFVVDEKTTQRLGPTWGAQWELRAQMSGYVWAARQHGYEVEGAIIRGISILKDSYGHAEVITYRPKWEIARWYNQLIRDVNRMIRCWEEGYWDYNFDSGCALFRKCDFMSLCDVENPEQWLADYEQKKWDPMGISEGED